MLAIIDKFQMEPILNARIQNCTLTEIGNKIESLKIDVVAVAIVDCFKQQLFNIFSPAVASSIGDAT